MSNELKEKVISRVLQFGLGGILMLCGVGLMAAGIFSSSARYPDYYICAGTCIGAGLVVYFLYWIKKFVIDLKKLSLGIKDTQEKDKETK